MRSLFFEFFSLQLCHELKWVKFLLTICLLLKVPRTLPSTKTLLTEGCTAVSTQTLKAPQSLRSSGDVNLWIYEVFLEVSCQPLVHIRPNWAGDKVQYIDYCHLIYLSSPTLISKYSYWMPRWSVMLIVKKKTVVCNFAVVEHLEKVWQKQTDFKVNLQSLKTQLFKSKCLRNSAENQSNLLDKTKSTSLKHISKLMF